MKRYVTMALWMVALHAGAAERSLFNGQDLTGWEGDLKTWRVEAGAITGGSLTERVPHNEFLVTMRSFHNFEFRAKIKLVGTTGFINSGIQFRSVRVPDNFEMSGYQADAGKGYWGTLYDETRRGSVVPKVIDSAALQAVLRPDGWNEYRIRTEGPHIQFWLNGVRTVDYIETAPGIAQDGCIGLQIHGGGKALVQFKDLFIQELPPTPHAPTWKQLGGYKPHTEKE